MAGRPFGYEVRDRKLIIREQDAEQVRAIFRRFVQVKSAVLLARELAAASKTNRYGHVLDKGVLYKLLHNRVYIGVPCTRALHSTSRSSTARCGTKFMPF